MTSCENNLFIHTGNKEHLLNILENSQKLFEGLVPLIGTKKECYGVDSDVYMDYVTFDTTDSDDLISLIFYTYEAPCLEFCKKLCLIYSVNVQLVYFNKDYNFSGNFKINNGVINKDILYSYWEGMYLLKFGLFWEIIPKTFKVTTFMEYYKLLKINMSESHIIDLKKRFDYFILLRQFEKL